MHSRHLVHSLPITQLPMDLELPNFWTSTEMKINPNPSVSKVPRVVDTLAETQVLKG